MNSFAKKLLKIVIPDLLRPIRQLEALTRNRTGCRIQKGPFEGMQYISYSVGSALIPKLLGIYERELYPLIDLACNQQFPLIVDIGAAEGYYAVGLAQRNPQARVIAFEMEVSGRTALKQLASFNGIGVKDWTEVGRSESAHRKGKNRSGKPPYHSSKSNGNENEPHIKVSHKIELHGKCEFENLDSVISEEARAFVICDVEGYEDILLVPQRIPALARATLLVETHEFVSRGVTTRIKARFSDTHEIKCIWQEPRYFSEFPFRSWVTRLLPSRYQEIAVSEWRPERMCWLWMTPKEL